MKNFNSNNLYFYRDQNRQYRLWKCEISNNIIFFVHETQVEKYIYRGRYFILSVRLFFGINLKTYLLAKNKK